MPHFFLAPGAIADDAVTIVGSLATHVAGALRHRAGDHITVVGEDGRKYRIVVTESTTRRVRGLVVQSFRADEPPTLNVTLAQAVIKGSHMDDLMQKATELGVHRIAPLVTKRTVVRPREQRTSRQVERWQAIVLEAAQQSERSTVPIVDNPRPLDEWLKTAGTDDSTKLLLWERESSHTLRDYLTNRAPDRRAALLVGPEGGFDSDEVEHASAAGFIPVSIGRSILRAETAGVAALAILQYTWANLGGPQPGFDRAPRV